MLSEIFIDLDDIIFRRDLVVYKQVFRFQSVDSNVFKNFVEVLQRGCIFYYIFKFLLDLNFMIFSIDFQEEEEDEILLFDFIFVVMFIFILILIFVKFFFGLSGKMESQLSGSVKKRLRLVLVKFMNL